MFWKYVKDTATSTASAVTSAYYVGKLAFFLFWLAFYYVFGALVTTGGAAVSVFVLTSVYAATYISYFALMQSTKRSTAIDNALIALYVINMVLSLTTAVLVCIYALIALNGTVNALCIVMSILAIFKLLLTFGTTVVETFLRYSKYKVKKDISTMVKTIKTDYPVLDARNYTSIEDDKNGK